MFVEKGTGGRQRPRGREEEIKGSRKKQGAEEFFLVEALGKSFGAR